MIKIFAKISFIGNIIFFLITLFGFIPRNFDRIQYLIGFITIAIITLCNIFFIKRTNFGSFDKSELEQIENENKLLKLKIEQKKMEIILKK